MMAADKVKRESDIILSFVVIVIATVHLNQQDKFLVRSRDMWCIEKGTTTG